MNPAEHSGRKTVAGIILAAGESRRMGRDKALLPLGEQSFLGHLIEVLRGEVAPLVVVLGHHAAQIEREIEGFPGLTILRNPDYQQGQLSSLQVALRHLQALPVQGALVWLVDHPAAPKNVARLLLERFEQSGAPILIPTFQGRRGHPVLFASGLFGELLEAPLEEGARFVVRHHAEEVELVETEEEGILLDIDLPSDYEKLLARRLRESRSEPRQ